MGGDVVLDDYQPNCATVNESTVCLGHTSCCVIILNINIRSVFIKMHYSL